MRSYLTTFVLALLLGLWLTPLAGRLGRRIGALDSTRDPPVPRSGGLAIVAATATALVLLALIFQPSRNLLGLGLSELGPVFLAAGVILLVGVADDVWRLKPRIKFGVEVLVAAGLYFAGVRASTIWLPFGIVSLGAVFGLLFTVFWIVLITNAFNLLDGIDGGAAGAAVFALLAMFMTSVALHNPLVAILAAAVAGATLGFLPYNIAPARLFLGDTGSLFLGFILAALSIKGATKGPTLVAIAIPLVAFALPLMDTSITVFRRALRGAPVFAGDHEHLHHRLLALGLTTRQAAGFIYVVSAGFALASMLFLNPNVRGVAVVLTMVGLLMWFAVSKLHLHEFSELARIAQRGLSGTRAISFNVDVRKAAQDLERCAVWDDIAGTLARLFDASEFDAVRLVLYDGGAGRRRREFLLDRGRILEQTVSPQQDQWGVHVPFRLGGGRAGSVEGELAVFRRYGRGQLLTDVNLLVEVLRPALAAAAGRVAPPAHA
jgi:UDP-GlcNAc:undecaprenyl-phosphate GlcNAc-1-phosphate transferase